ncbi:DUF1801 domain-containing protein [Pelomonas sp. SE-A7]|uniref:DUF1801 domain-containing protein n=1 Tax=Pelomonas sp. SE-A7 TaxID=3054953 RepID=UPI00259CF110|nr:DUF1801 domain-containing protein [Pelomonas sp. SE-A7]MDM4764707.1 DUF1801 domain-containing protein [Pelomonas sp. SE-A7]
MARTATTAETAALTRRLLMFPDGRREDPDVRAWFEAHAGELGALAGQWFAVVRACGDEVMELLHDGHPTACVSDAGFAYVNVFTAHLNLGFFRGAELPDPQGLLEGSGRFMRHIKLRPGEPIDEGAVKALIAAAYADMRRRLAESA